MFGGVRFLDTISNARAIARHTHQLPTRRTRRALVHPDDAATHAYLLDMLPCWEDAISFSIARYHNPSTCRKYNFSVQEMDPETFLI